MSNLATLKPFKKGEDPRRNTTGANKGSRSLTKLAKDALLRIAEGQSEAYDELLIKRVMKMAIVDGNEQMIKLLWNYTDGLPRETKDINLTMPTPIDEIRQDNRVQADKEPQ